MSRRFLVAGLIVAAVSLAFCSDDNRTPIVPTTQAPVVTGLRVTGNTQRLDVNQTVQLAAVATLSDGTSRDVSAETAWRTFNTAIATVSATGLLTAVALGRTGLQAQYQGRFANLDVLVLPPGTFIVRGTVVEPGSLPVLGARLEVLDGPHAGRSTITGYGGMYEMYGLAGFFRMRATRDGYGAATTDVSVTQDQVLNFELRPAVAPQAVAGNYRLTLTASNSCASQLREDARTRTFDALINQDAARLLVNLSGAEFALRPGNGSGNYFSGAVRTNVVTFTISIDDYYYYYYDSFDLVERLGPTTYLTVGGTATATAAPRNITGNLNGRFALWEAATSFYGSKRNVASCNAPDHRFSFIR